MYDYAMGKLADHMKNKSAYFTVHNVPESEILAYWEKEMRGQCKADGIDFITPTTLDRGGNNMLAHMSLKGVSIMLPLLVNQGYDPVRCTPNNESVLHLACYRALLNRLSLPQVIDLLACANKYNSWNAEDSFGKTPLFHLVEMHQRWNAVIKTVGASKDPDGDTVALIEYAIANGANPHHRAHNGKSFVSDVSDACFAPFHALVQKAVIDQQLDVPATMRPARKM